MRRKNKPEEIEQVITGQEETESEKFEKEGPEAEVTETEETDLAETEPEELQTEETDAEEPVEEDAPQEFSRTKKKRSKRIVSIIIAVLVVLLAAAGFAYANVRLNAPAEIIKEGSDYYCLDGRGNKKVSCWIDFENNRYYAGEDGKLYADRMEKIEDGTYCFAEDAALIGGGIFSFHDKIMSSDPDGKLVEVEGWEEHDGNTYYNTGTGECKASELMELDGETYYLDPSGVLQKSTVFEHEGKQYYADPDGKILKNQPVEHQGNNYYAGADGAFVKNGFTPYENYYFYINENSVIAKEPVTLENGYTVTPDPNTGAISAEEYKISQSEYIYNGQATYIKVVIDDQYLEYVKDGELKVSSYVVTGMYDKYDTPRGTYEILYKARNVQLKGEIVLDGEYEEVPLTEEEKNKIWDAMTPEEKKDPNAKSKIPSTKKVQKKEKWDVTVNYWLSFIGGTYGFHDATWRSYFGDYIYTYDGSHGCVNLPLWAAEELYNTVEDGTPVYII